MLAVWRVGQQLPLEGYAGFSKTFLQPFEKFGKIFHPLKPGPSCSKLTMSLVNDSLKF